MGGSLTDCPDSRICFINVFICGKFGSSYMGKVRAKRGFHLQNNLLRFCYAVKMQQEQRSVQFIPVQVSSLTDWVVEGTYGTIQKKSSSCLFCRRSL